MTLFVESFQLEAYGKATSVRLAFTTRKTTSKLSVNRQFTLNCTIEGESYSPFFIRFVARSKMEHDPSVPRERVPERLFPVDGCSCRVRSPRA